MLRPDEMQKAMAEARTLILESILKHEREAHQGEPCMGNRASAVAYLAHCLSVRWEAWEYAEELLIQYDRDCVDPNCPHHARRTDGR